MRKTFVTMLFLFSGWALFAQSIEVTPIFGYSIAGKVQNYGRYFDVKNDALYGGLLSVQFDDMMYAELSYERSDTKGSGFLTTVDMAVEHYQVGMLREFSAGTVIPFAKVSFGTSRYVQTSGGDERTWLFSGGIGAGAKVFLSDRVGLRLFTNLMLPLEFDGAGFWCGIGTGGSGCSGGVSFNVPIVHWDLGAGLIIRLQD
ncbi:porin family protein [Draconibacterium mangrovi]|uniref:porin family protein n=1 Tax=Draconibacterium mangrovi TaxID=2697469 RepID=UPI0013D76403|nr:porin family protein [Draconibacterium mangrovi]